MQVRFVAHQVAIVVVCLLLLPGHIGAGEAPTNSKIRLAALVERAEPSSPIVNHVPEAALIGKWRVVRERMRYDQRIVSWCRHDPAGCPSDAATLFMSIVDTASLREGRARIGEINRAINLAVRPVSDQRRHGGDDWASPLSTLASGEGDCEDYAIAKLAALWMAGFAENDTRLAIVRDDRAREDHALAMVRLEGRWLALDNRRFALMETAHLTYRPLYVIGGPVEVRVVSEDGAWKALDEENAAGLSAQNESGSAGARSWPVLL